MLLGFVHIFIPNRVFDYWLEQVLLMRFWNSASARRFILGHSLCFALIKINLGRNRVNFILDSQVTSHHWRKSRQEFRQAKSRRDCCLLVPHKTQDHLLRGGIACSRLGPPTSISNEVSAPTGNNSSVEVSSSQVTVVCIKLTQTQQHTMRWKCQMWGPSSQILIMLLSSLPHHAPPLVHFVFVVCLFDNSI